jgi:hypothetical protein
MNRFITSIALYISVPIIAAAQPSAWQRICSTQVQNATIISGALASPPTLDSLGNPSSTWDAASGRLEVQGIQYVSGSVIEVELFTNACTEIRRVQVGSTLMTPLKPYGGILPNYYWYDSRDIQNDLKGHKYSIVIGFPPLTDGSTEDVNITVGHVGGTEIASFEFPLVHVRLVEPSRAVTSVGISEAQIHNQFAKALYNRFNGVTNSVTINKTRIYDYDPSSLSTRIDPVGVWISFKFKASVDCNPTVVVNGTFSLVTRGGQFVVQWDNPVAVNTDIGWCDIAAAALKDIGHWGNLWFD